MGLAELVPLRRAGRAHEGAYRPSERVAYEQRSEPDPFALGKCLFTARKQGTKWGP